MTSDDARFARSSAVKVLVGIITYHRPKGLTRLLDSLGQLNLSAAGVDHLRIVVVDNDPEEGARDVCTRYGASDLDVQYRVEERQGIPFARNAVLEAFQEFGDVLAFVDDDEEVTSSWLSRLLTTWSSTGADVVAGPVLPLFEEEPPSWVVRGGLFNRKRMATGTVVKHVGSGNVLISKRILDTTGVRFDERLAHTGGSDTLFFLQLVMQGAVIVWDDEAIVHEWQPASRVNARWLIQRAYRGGNSFVHCTLAIHDGPLKRLSRLGAGLARVIQGTAQVPIALVTGRTGMVQALQTIAKGIGAITGVFGARFNEYRTTHGS